MRRRALVTGITGFIGGNLAERLLADGWQVDAIVRPQSEVEDLPFGRDVTLHTVVEGQDLTSVLADIKPDIVFHLASLYLAEHTAVQVEPLVRSNILFPTQLMEAMVAAAAGRLVNTGTAWQHFEGEPNRPVNLYAATKQAAQDLLAYYTDAKGLAAITLKLFDTYGVGDKRRKLIGILIDAARSGLSLDMSPGEQIVDLSHVDDVVEAFMVAAERLLTLPGGSNERYFVAGERCTVRELVGKVEAAAGRSSNVNFGGRPYRDREVMQPVVPQPDERLPGWEPRHSLKTTLPRLLGG